MQVRPDRALGDSLKAALAHWRSTQMVSGIDHRSIIEKLRQDGGWSSHFAVMTLLSAGIAVLGLLLSSPAVVIGAMLISPLMDPIIGLGFAVATFDGREMRRSGGALLAGTVLAVVFCAAIVLLSPLQSVTGEITSRTRPNLFDLLVALFAGLAGTYAMIRGRHGAIVGVAIATALIPPLAVIGFGIATWDLPVVGGSSLLFFTNLMTIAVAAAILARFYGFAPDLSPHQTRLQAVLILLVLIALAVPLGLSLKQIAWEAFATREARQMIASEFPSDARVSNLDIDFHSRPVEIEGTVLTPTYRATAETDLRREFGELMRGPVVLSIEQVRTSDGSEPTSANASVEQRAVSRLTDRVALVAGVPPNDILVDPTAKRVFVRAAAMAGADVTVYRELESRVAATAPDWSINLVPPAAPLPAVSVKDGTADDAAIQAAIWAAQRLHLPIGVTARRQADAKLVAGLLDKAGVETKVMPGPAPTAAVSLKWIAPEQGSEASAVNGPSGP